MPYTYSQSLTTLAIDGPAAGLCLSGAYGGAKCHAPSEREVRISANALSPVEISCQWHLYREYTLIWHTVDKPNESSRREFKFWLYAQSNIRNDHDLFNRIIAGYHPLAMQEYGKR